MRSNASSQSDICGEYVDVSTAITIYKSPSDSTGVYEHNVRFSSSGSWVAMDLNQEKTSAHTLLGPYTAAQLTPQSAYDIYVTISDKFYTVTNKHTLPVATAYQLPTVSITGIRRVAPDGVTEDALGGYLYVMGRYTMTETSTQPQPTASIGKVADKDGNILPTLVHEDLPGDTDSAEGVPLRFSVPDGSSTPSYVGSDRRPRSQAVTGAASGANTGLYLGEYSNGSQEYYWPVVATDELLNADLRITSAVAYWNVIKTSPVMVNEQDMWSYPGDDYYNDDTGESCGDIPDGSTFSLTAIPDGTINAYVSRYSGGPSGGLGVAYEYSNDVEFEHGVPSVNSEYGLSYDGDRTFTSIHAGSNDVLIYCKFTYTSTTANEESESHAFVPESGHTLDDYLIQIDPQKQPYGWIDDSTYQDLDETKWHFQFKPYTGCGWDEGMSSYFRASLDRLEIEYEILTPGVVPGTAEGPNTIDARTNYKTLKQTFGEMLVSVMRPDDVYYATFTVSDRFNTATVTAQVPISDYTFPMIYDLEPKRVEMVPDNPALPNGPKHPEPSDDGTDLIVDVSWAIYGSVTQTEPQEFNVTVVSEEGQTIVDRDYTFPATTSGKPTELLFKAGDSDIQFDPPFSQDLQYTVTVTVGDRYAVRNLSSILASAFFTLDVKKGGHGIAFGKPATRQVMDVRFPGYFDQAFHIGEQLALPVYHRLKVPKSALPCLPAIVLVETSNGVSTYLAEEGSDITAEPKEAEMHTSLVDYDATMSYYHPADYTQPFKWPSAAVSGTNPGWYAENDTPSGEHNPYYWTAVPLPAGTGKKFYSVIDAYFQTDSGQILRFVPESGNTFNDYVIDMDASKPPFSNSAISIASTGKFFHFKHFTGCGWHADTASGNVNSTLHVVYEVEDE